VDTFNFCPNSLVPVTLPPDVQQGMSMNGWQFTGRPTVPYQKRFKVMLHGLRWYTHPNSGHFNPTANPTINARALEIFYEKHGVWSAFKWMHPHYGEQVVRFFNTVTVPEGIPDSGGLINPVEINLIQHNPGYV
jgi:hypothetical protein